MTLDSNTAIARPRLVVLDTSHLGALAKDAFSSERQRRKTAKRFVAALVSKGAVPLLSFHQVVELMQHANDQVVDRRLAFLRTLPLVAWVRGDHDEDLPGSVIELHAAEVAHLLNCPDASLYQIRDLARDSVLCFGSGADAIPDMGTDWRLLKPALKERQAHTQKVTAISRWRAASINETRIGDLLYARVMPRAQANQVIEGQLESLTREVAERGDKRIASAASVASEFMWDVVKGFDSMNLVEGKSPVLQMLLALGVAENEIDPNETFGELMYRVTFDKQLRVVAQKAGLPWPAVKANAKLEQLPVAVVQDALRRYSQDQPERKASGLDDVHLLCLAAYAEVTFVDKRTLNDLRQAKSKVSELGVLLGKVVRAAEYSHVLNHLD